MDWLILLALQVKVGKVASFVGKILVVRPSTTNIFPHENYPLYGGIQHAQTECCYISIDFTLCVGYSTAQQLTMSPSNSIPARMVSTESSSSSPKPTAVMLSITTSYIALRGKGGGGVN